MINELQNTFAFPEVPAGGFKQSGFGREFGVYGIEASYSHKDLFTGLATQLPSISVPEPPVPAGFLQELRPFLRFERIQDGQISIEWRDWEGDYAAKFCAKLFWFHSV